jgi:hypothetical protein
MEKLTEVLTAITKRDVRAQNPKKTSSISTRTLILDTNNTAGGLLYAANQLFTAVLAKLELTR